MGMGLVVCVIGEVLSSHLGGKRRDKLSTDKPDGLSVHRSGMRGLRLGGDTTWWFKNRRLWAGILMNERTHIPLSYPLNSSFFLTATAEIRHVLD